MFQLLAGMDYVLGWVSTNMQGNQKYSISVLLKDNLDCIFVQNTSLVYACNCPMLQCLRQRQVLKISEEHFLIKKELLLILRSILKHILSSSRLGNNCCVRIVHSRLNQTS